MVHLTGNFLSEAPLASHAQAALNDALDQGWADPRKLGQSGARARILADEARSSLAENLGFRPDELEILGEPALGLFYGLSGLLRKEDLLLYSAVDRSEIFASARLQERSVELAVSHEGLIDPVDLRKYARERGTFAFQVANGETGVIQEVESIIAQAGSLFLACDYTAASTCLPLPSRWDSAVFDAKSWQGPQGIGIVAIRNSQQWRNPLPHIGQGRTPQSASLPLLIAAALALEQWREEEADESTRLRSLNHYLRSEIASSISDCDIAGQLDSSLPHVVSISFLYVHGEELLRNLERKGFWVDSGSACTAQNLQPSHVLAAMGLLTHGNIRITLHHGSTEAEVKELVNAIKESVHELRET